MLVLTKRFVILSLFWNFFVLSPQVMAHDNPLIATVNIIAVEQESIAWKKKIIELEEQFTRNRDTISQREQSLQAELSEYEKQRPLLSQQQQQERDAEINQKLAELQNTAGQMNANIDQDSAISNQNLRVKIAEIIQAIADERKLDLILEVGNDNFSVAYFTQRLDITAEVIKRLNNTYPAIQL